MVVGPRSEPSPHNSARAVTGPGYRPDANPPGAAIKRPPVLPGSGSRETYDAYPGVLTRRPVTIGYSSPQPLPPPIHSKHDRQIHSAPSDARWNRPWTAVRGSLP